MEGSMSQLATKEEGAVARPLKVLEPLIRQDIAEAELAGRPHYEAAALKLIEAQEGHFDGDNAGFYRWAERVTGKSQTTIRAWIAFGASAARKSFKTKEHHARAPKAQGGLGHQPRVLPGLRREWTAPVDQIARQAFEEAQRLAREQSLTRKQEREADRKLALRLIDIGFKVLAREPHPDKGGSRDAMARLNRVRNHLKECI